MRKLNHQEKTEVASMLAMLVVLLRVIKHMIIEAEKNAKWMQGYGIRTTLMIKTLYGANELIRKVAYRLYDSVYYQIDNAHIYSVGFDDIMCRKSCSDVYQYSNKLDMDSLDTEVKRLAEQTYQYISGGKDYGN